MASGDKIFFESKPDFNTFKTSEYFSHSMARQAIIDGNFQIAQAVPVAGTDVTINTAQTPAYPVFDMWQFYSTPNGGTFPTVKMSQHKLDSGELLGSAYSHKLNVDGAGSNFGAYSICYTRAYIENGVRYLCGAGKKLTVSFYVKSNITGKKLGIYLGQVYGTGGSPTAAEPITGECFPLTSSWQKFTYTFTTSTLAGKVFGTNNDDYLFLTFAYLWGSEYASAVGETTAETFIGAGDIEIAQVQLCAGDVALPFEPKSFADELRACQRYYERTEDYLDTTNPYIYTPFIGLYANGIGNHSLFKVTKRISPSFTVYSPATMALNSVYDLTTGNTITDVYPAYVSKEGDVFINKQGAFVTGRSYNAHWIADARF